MPVSVQQKSTKSRGQQGKSRDTQAKRKQNYSVPEIKICVIATFNNTRVVVTKTNGDVLDQCTAGSDYRGARKSTPHAGSDVANKVLSRVVEKYSVKTAVVIVKGPGPGRDAALRAITEKVRITSIEDRTNPPFNGCRAKKKRRC